MKHMHKEYLQSAMFGITDALVSTTGVVVGVATGTNDKNIVVLVGTVTILVEAMSMGAGQFLSSESADQLVRHKSSRIPLVSGIIMFSSYFMAGLVPLLSVILVPMQYARIVAVVAALSCLLLIGFAKGKLVHVSPTRSALEVLTIGGIATVVGIIVGSFYDS